MASLFLFFSSSFLLFPFCSSANSLNPDQTIEDGQTLLSPGGIFALGFFSPGNSKNRYLGIWYNKVPDKAVVWVANRENPVPNSLAILLITRGNLVLIDGRDQSLVWSTNVSTVTSNYSSTATLMDSGNLVLKDDGENTIWESFDHPTDAFLPGMKLGLDRRSGLNRALTSWKSAEDPARGEFWFGLVVGGMPQFFLMKGSSDRIFRSGPWKVSNRTYWRIRYVNNDDEIYITLSSPYDTALLTRLVLDESGVLQRLTWRDKSHQWNLGHTLPRDRCDNYARCGPYGICNSSQIPESECECLQGFKPRSARDWRIGDWTDGCTRRKTLDCGKGDGFLRLAYMKLPDTSRSIVEPRLSLQECRDFCIKNCSCTAYSSANVSGEGNDCVMWGEDLIDLKVNSDAGQEMYARVAASELDREVPTKIQGGRKKKRLLATLTTILVLLALISCSYCWWRIVKSHKVKERVHDTIFNENNFEGKGKDPELPLFDLGVVSAATNSFSQENILGEGGFGPVYKGKLLNGRMIAVKKLSNNSGQGSEEFKNEVTLIVKLQHRNLVRLLGCCIAGEEKMLIYEYMKNKSLDYIIFCIFFNQTRSVMLNWRKRFDIVVGIARGVLYLHEDSRLRIIHRDLKVSNILLDNEMNPKISDFGIARMFGGDQTYANTRRVVGTYGYMSPEYAMNGRFSVKSDVFSFGVLLLEIISGKRNNYCNDCSSLTLIGHVWEMWKEGRATELVDSSMRDSCCQSEVSRCIQVGLLCVQESAEDRPNMSSVLFMLCNLTTMVSPNEPAFYLRKGLDHDRACCSANKVTLSELEAR